MTRDASQSAVASSSTIWAKASKEWVIPAKPKPGRKPKKEVVEQQDNLEVDSKGRRVQNRAAQRAFRERKQSQLAELQARVQSYEQGEIERNVALQNIAKKLKEENEQLVKENQSLKDELERFKIDRALEKSLSAFPISSSEQQNTDTRKRWRDDEHESLAVDRVAIFSNSNELAVRKRQRVGTDSPMLVSTPNPILQQHRHVYTASPPSFASSPESIDTFSPSPYAPHGAHHQDHQRSPSLIAHHHGGGVAPPLSTPVPSAPSHLYPATMSVRISSGLYNSFDVDSFSVSAGGPSFDGFDNCGLCNDNTPCVCRDNALRQYDSGDASLPSLKIEPLDQNPSIISIPPATEEDSINSMMSSRRPATQSRTSPSVTNPSSSSILDSLPAFQPAVPLRRNVKSTGERTKTLFQIRLPSPSPQPPVAPTSNAGRPAVRRAATSTTTISGSKRGPRATSNALCSGDPSNCAACKDDDFGKAFCTALGDSMCSTSPCATCPSPEECSSKQQEKGKASETRSSASSRPEMQRSVTVAAVPTSTIAPKALMKTAPLDGSISSGSSSARSTDTPSQPTASSSKMPANEAWQQLKSHPNIAFADLAMLADVVARRTKCSGPVVVVHPPLGSLTPERSEARSPATSDDDRFFGASARHCGESSPILLTDPHAHFREQEEQRSMYHTPGERGGTSVVLGDGAGLASAPTAAGISQAPPLRQISLVPQEELRQCGRARLREVDAAGVKDALRILDAQFGRQ